MAIVGAGASGTAVLAALAREQRGNERGSGIEPLSVAVIDRAVRQGHGRVYGPDHPWLLMNTPAHALSILGHDKGHFVRWLRDRDHQDTVPVEHAHVPRSLYGAYLQEQLTALLAGCCPLLRVSYLDSWVERLELDPDTGSDLDEEQVAGVRLRLADGRTLTARKVVLATGPSAPDDPYGLRGQAGYVHHPYPAAERLGSIPSDHDVAVVGSSLSAVDTALTLREAGHRGRVMMVSRRGVLPEVKSHYEVVRDAYEQAAGAPLSGDVTTLKSALEASRAFLSTGAPAKDSVSAFKDSVRHAEHPTANGFAHRYSTHLGMDQVWPRLSEAEMLAFMRAHHAEFLHKNAAIPLVNGRKLLSMIMSGALTVHGALLAVRPDPEGGFRLTFKDGATRTADSVVNATGPSRYLVAPGARHLYAHLLHEGRLRELSTGGARVTYPDGALIGRDGQPVPGLHAVGHPTIGSHPYINNVELIVSNSALVARAVCRDLQRGRTAARTLL
ncbi:hypothetical protein GCM10014713_03880 [Streptomyces purpureus]|uniref:FAD-dependent urate hydroxylase HpyO/Asp monooxygenase CreE-like FAD/NAD(P)-binding domain-containing protein n=1 Tax=Streptomyces purpureus TaxID=1951 RepID=A0A918GXC1_9ACTN|nr:hypothetical protein GCM10014713_03880 [Streptomyces purpureus]